MSTAPSATPALTALVVSSVSERAVAGDLAPTLAAVAVGVTLAVRGASMLRIVAAGGLVYATALAAAAVVV